MMRLALLAIVLLPLGCASARTSSFDIADSKPGFVLAAPSAEVLPPAPDAARGANEADPFEAFGTEAPAGFDTTEPVAAPATAVSEPAPVEEKDLRGSRFTVKGGYYSADETALDDGFILNLSWMTFFTSFFAVEFELGYIDTSGSDSGADTDLWAVPVMVNGRFNLPVWILDLYAGAGLGGFYYDFDTSGVVSDDGDGWLWGGNAFLGATINLGDAIALGLEAKYYMSEDISDTDANLDAYALMLTLGFSR